MRLSSPGEPPKEPSAADYRGCCRELPRQSACGEGLTALGAALYAGLGVGRNHDLASIAQSVVSFDSKDV